MKEKPVLKKSKSARPVAKPVATAASVAAKPVSAGVPKAARRSAPKPAISGVAKASSASPGKLGRRKTAGQRPGIRRAKFALGDVVRHRFYPFRGVIYDIDPVFNNSEEWWMAIPEAMRPRKDQPYYHLLAENDETEYIAYVSEQNLQPDESGEPLRHPRLAEFFVEDDSGRYRVLQMQAH